MLHLRIRYLSYLFGNMIYAGLMKAQEYFSHGQYMYIHMKLTRIHRNLTLDDDFRLGNDVSSLSLPLHFLRNNI